jgi:hypothetical protein
MKRSSPTNWFHFLYQSIFLFTLVLIIISDVKPVSANALKDDSYPYDGVYSGSGPVQLDENYSGTSESSVTIAKNALTGESDITASSSFGEITVNSLYQLTLSGQVDANGAVTGSVTGTGTAQGGETKISYTISGTFTGTISGTEMDLKLNTTFSANGCSAGNCSGNVNAPLKLNKAGTDCIPSIRNLDGLKPGDTISPGASYTSSDGNATNVISETWYINGKETNSSVWDGAETKVELQYTCSDNSAHTQTYTIPAYIEATATATTTVAPEVLITPTTAAIVETIQPSEEPTNSTLLGVTATSTPEPSPSGGIGILPVLGGIVLGGGFITGGILTALGIKAAVNASTAVNTAAAVVPAASAPAAPSSPVPPSQAVNSDVSQPQTRLTEQQKNQLQNHNIEMQTELEKLRDEYNTWEDLKTHLKTTNKKNMIRFILKKGLDTVDVINKSVDNFNPAARTFDKTMEKFFQKHDTSKDGQIIVDIQNKLEQINARQSALRKEIIHLKSEISQTDQLLAGEGE